MVRFQLTRRSMAFNAAACLVLLTALPLPAAGQQPAIAPNLNNTVGNSAAYLWGMQFTPAEDLVVTHLGWFDHLGDGFANGPHPVGIYRVDDQSLVASANCTTSSALENGFRYEPITPVVLISGQQYLVVGFDPSGNGDFLLRDLDFNNINAHPDLTVEGTRDQFGASGLDFPTGSLDTTPSSWRMGANFKLLVSQQDIWTGNDPVGGNLYFNHGPNWADLTTPTEIDNARFQDSSDLVSWSNNFGGDTIGRNLFLTNSDLTFRSTDTPVKTHSVTENLEILGGSLTLGNSSTTPMNLDIGGQINVDDGDLILRHGSQIAVNRFHLNGTQDATNGIALGSLTLIESTTMNVLSEDCEINAADIEIEGAAILMTDAITLGSYTGAWADVRGKVSIADPMSSWISGDVSVRHGLINIGSGATATVDALNLGVKEPSGGADTFARSLVEITDVGSELTCNSLSAGFEGSHDILIRNGAKIVSTSFCRLGLDPTPSIPAGGRVLMRIEGTGSSLTTDSLTVGWESYASLAIVDAGLVECTELYVGRFSSYAPLPLQLVDVVTVDGGSLVVDGFIELGRVGGSSGTDLDAYGELRIEAGLVSALETRLAYDSMDAYGTVILEGGEFHFGKMTLSEYSIMEKTAGLLAGKVVFDGVHDANTIESNLASPNVDTSQVRIQNEGLIHGSGTIDRDLCNTATGEVEVGSFESLQINGDVTNELDGQIQNTGGTLTINGALVNEGLLSSVATVEVTQGITNHGELTFDSGTIQLTADVVNAGSGLFNLTSTLLTLDGDLTTASGGSISVDASSELSILGIWTGLGTFTGSGNLVFAGTVRPGIETSEISLGGNVILSPFANTEIELGGTDAGEFDRLVIQGDLAIGGQLQVQFVNGFQLQPGMEFEIANVNGQTFDRFDGLEEGSLVGIFNNINLFITYVGGDGNDVVLTTIPPIALVAESFEVTRGVLFAGGIGELSASDNMDVSIRRQTSDILARTEFVVTTTSPTTDPSAMLIRTEGSVFARSTVTQTVAVYDYHLLAWETVDSRSASRLMDRTDEISLSGDLSRFVSPTDNEIKVRLRFHSNSPRQNFTSNTDLLSWRIGQ